ncbi:XkdQ [Clostridium senegalense]|uniref:XkdQ/YqbQ family protein n=1 Tax=Clostridium senegalense TaxID=1465809 RepID=UPI001C123F85|nr:XkdQ [Clostridium senegalense]MBU5227860.1 XkdQ [Clostridium senegalense]
MELILRNKYKITLTAESGTLKESIDGIAYTLNLTLINTKEFENLGIAKGQSIELYDYAFNSKDKVRIFSGIVWDINKSKKTKKMSITCKERTVYIEESEDEFLCLNGQTATQRATLLCKEWNIPIGSFANTKIGLTKDRRKESIYSMMWKDLKETAQNGGGLFKFRMETKLNLIKLGSNSIVYRLDSILDDVQPKSSLSGAVTQVKALGKNDKDDTKSPIIGIFKKNTEGYGTIQKIVQDDKIQNYASAQNKANALFNNGEDSIDISCVQDINVIRAGDVTSLYDTRYYVTDITHNLGGKGSMDLTLMDWEGVKKKFYGE